MDKIQDAQKQPFWNNSYPLIVVGLIALLIICIFCSLMNGQADISFYDTFQILLYKISNGRLGNVATITNPSAVNIIWFVRAPRVFLALFVGMGLAVSGTVMQAVVQNPLADPYILGISSGSSLGATFAILIGFGSVSFFSQFGLAFGAFTGAVLASFSVLVLSSVGGKMTSIKLILSGTVISALFSAISNFIVYMGNNAEGIRWVTFWLMGSLAAGNWAKLPIIASVVTGVTLFFLSQYRILNVMLLGDEAASTLGIKLANYRRIYLILTSLLTGVIVAYSGMIGFVGLIIPHMVRGIVGTNHKRLMPVVALSGAIFLVGADLFSRIVLSTTELPIGIITSAIGAPMFIYIIIKKGYRFGG